MEGMHDGRRGAADTAARVLPAIAAACRRRHDAARVHRRFRRPGAAGGSTSPRNVHEVAVQAPGPPGLCQR